MIFHLRVFEFFASMAGAKKFTSQVTGFTTGYFMNFHLRSHVMNDLHLFGGVVNAPAFLPADVIAECGTYREAVRTAWAHRRIKAMTQRSLAERTECYPSHVSDYLHADDKPTRRSLPADKVSAFCAAVGNWGVQQWLNRQSKLTILEEVIAERSAA